MISNDNFYVRPVLSRFGAFFTERGYDVISFCASPEEYRRLVDEYELSGVVIFVPKAEFAPSIEQLHSEGVPVISIGYANPVLPGIAFGTDHEKTVDMAVDYLYKLGHRKIALLNSINSASSQIYLRGYQKAMWERSLPVHPDWHLYLNMNSQVSYDEQLAENIRSLQTVPTAIVIGQVPHSVPAYRAANKLGLRIPEDLSLIGLGSGMYLEDLTPPLTVIAQNLEQISDNAANTLFGKIMDDSFIGKDIECAVAPLLIERGSCAPIE